MKSNMKKFFLAACLAIIGTWGAWAQKLVEGEVKGIEHQSSYMPTYKSDGSKKAPLNVILMIGDGTGLAQIASGYYANGGELTVMNLKHIGFVTTQSKTDFITDSAASGTAYASGQKTYNYSIGLDLDKQPIPNIPERVAPLGIISGVVSTDDLNGATPASFFAHQANRGMTQEIWADIPGSCLTFFGAGHKELFAAQPESTRKGILDNFTIVERLDDPAAAGARRLGYLPPSQETTYLTDGRGDFLPVTTQYAIDFLNARTARKKGFFLMVEGARIDKCSHKNDFRGTVLEMMDFDKAIEAAIRFADEDGHTLVVISADHETGGLSLANGKPENGDLGGRFATGGHSPIPVPIFAYGPHAQDFTGVLGNEEVAQRILKLLLKK